MKVGRNDPCPCGSKKKYKQCCLAKDSKAKGPLSTRARALHGNAPRALGASPNATTPPPRPLKAVWINQPAKAPEERPNLIERTFGHAIEEQEKTSLQPEYPLPEPTLQTDDKEESK